MLLKNDGTYKIVNKQKNIKIDMRKDDILKRT